MSNSVTRTAAQNEKKGIRQKEKQIKMVKFKTKIEMGRDITTKEQLSTKNRDQVIIAQWLAWRLATGYVLGSNPGKGDNLLTSD